MDLSILIATVPPRKKYLNRLLTKIQKQIVDNNLQGRVEVIVYEDDFEASLGQKKNKLYKSAKGKYTVSIDDDDDISDDYCKTICDVIKEYDVDQICIGHRYFHNNSSRWIPIYISKKYKYYSLVFKNLFYLYITKYHLDKNCDWELCFKKIPILRAKEKGLKMFFIVLFLHLFKNKVSSNIRHTCHTTPIKREITQSVDFTSRPREQDIEWATEIYKQGLIKTEHILDKDLYFYYYDHEMSINRGKWGRLEKNEKRKKLTEVTNTIKDIDWELQPIDKIEIKWI